MSISAGVVRAIALQQIDHAPHAKASAEGNHKGLQSGDGRSEKRGLPPFYSKKYDLKQHPNYRFTAEADKVKNAFDLDRLIDRRRRPGMNEECEVYEVSVPDEALTDEDEDILNYDDLDDPDAFV